MCITLSISFAGQPYILHPSSYTLHPSPYTLHPTSPPLVSLVSCSTLARALGLGGWGGARKCLCDGRWRVPCLPCGRACRREDIRMLQLLARDPLPLSTYACEFIVMGNQLGMIASDDQRNLQIFIFNPNSPEYRRQQLIWCVWVYGCRGMRVCRCGGGVWLTDILSASPQSKTPSAYPSA